MKTSYYILLSCMFIILACSENDGDPKNVDTYCQFDLPGTYKFRNISSEDGYCGEVNYQIPDDVFSGYFSAILSANSRAAWMRSASTRVRIRPVASSGLSGNRWIATR